MSQKWTPEEIESLKEQWPEHGRRSKIPNRFPSQIASKANDLGLRVNQSVVKRNAKRSGRQHQRIISDTPCTMHRVCGVTAPRAQTQPEQVT